MATLVFKAAPAAFLLAFSINGAQAGTPSTAACPALWQKTLPRLQDDKPQNLCQFAGKVALVVNTASYCGFTSQYEGLEKVYAKYQQRGLVVLGFPSNDFGQQEPGSSRQIADFCFNTYGVKFPMFAKSTVTGPQASPLFKELATLSRVAPRWNFHKYLIDRQGRVVDNFPSATPPEDPRLLAQIEKALLSP
jgi:glutathione peroxidase